MGRNKWKDRRRESMLAWQSGEYADECHERWTNADMVWAYNYGFKHGLITKRTMEKKIKEWHNAVVQGLNNGLTHTIWDGRRNDINWVRKRLALWEAFGRCVFAFHNNQDWSSDEKELFEIAKEGYSHKN